MKRLSSKFSLIVSAIVFALAIFLVPQVSRAEDLITVSFERSPLFDEANFLPGDTVTRGFTVRNVSSGNLKVSLILDPYNDDDDLGSQIQAIIKEDGSPSNIFSGTLDGLASSGPLTLKSGLAPGASVIYDFSATFNPAANNDYQSTDENPVSLFFDIVIGAESQSGQFQAFGSTSGSGTSAFIPSNAPGGPGSPGGEVEGISTPPPETTENPPAGGSLGGQVGGRPFIPSGQINGGAAATHNLIATGGTSPGEILGETLGVTVNPQTKPGTCSPFYWWWWIGYLVYAILIALAFWLTRKRKVWWIYLAPTLLVLAALVWWWFEPCPKHLWYWPAGIIVWFIGWMIWHINQLQNEQPQLPLDNPPATPS